MRSRGTRRLAAALLALALPVASAHAARPRGSLAGLPGERGCITELAAKGCAFGRALFGRDVVVSPDGRNVYFGATDAVSVFARTPRSGGLTQLPGIQGCVGWRGTQVVDGPCATARGLIGSTVIAITRDGRFLYAVAEDTRSIVVFARSAATGALRQLPGRRGCLRVPGAGGWRVRGCGRARALGFPTDLIVSPDGRFLYVASVGPSRLTVFRRNASTGAVRQLRGRAGCVSPHGRAHCSAARFLRRPLALTASRDGHTVYVASSENDAVTVLRPTRTGALREPAGRAGCVAVPEGDASDQICTPVRELFGPSSVALAPDGRTLYVAENRGVLSIRRAEGRLTQLPGPLGCLGSEPGCLHAHANAADGVESLALSPDGRNLYAGAVSNTVLALGRRDDGSLRPLPGRAGCVSRGRLAGCVQTRGLTRPLGLAVSPDGRNLYVAAFSDQTGAGGIGVLRRRR